MQNLGFTHLNLFDGKLASDLQEDVTIPLDDLMALENVVHVVYRGHLIEKPTYKKVKALEKHQASRFFEKHIFELGKR